jgi:hypothetical protein
MKNLLKTGSWVAAVAGFLFVGANVDAQSRFRQSFARPAIPSFQPRIANPALNSPFLVNQFGVPFVTAPARATSIVPNPAFNNPFLNPTFNTAVIPSAAFNNAAAMNRTALANGRLTNPFFLNSGFNQPLRLNSLNNPFLNTNPFIANWAFRNSLNPAFNQTGFFNPYLGFPNATQMGNYNPYFGSPNATQMSSFNPYLGFPNFSQTGFYNPYTMSGFPSQATQGFTSPTFLGY